MIDGAATRTEITEHLWRYLSSAGTGSPQPFRLEDVPLLTRGNSSDVRRRAALSVIQKVPVQPAIDSFREVLRRLPTSIDFDRVELEGHVVGRVDWVASRLRGATNAGSFVCDVPIRSSSLPLNRALRALLEGYLGFVLTLRRTEASPAHSSEFVAIAGGSSTLAAAEVELRDLLGHRKIAGLRPSGVLEDRHLERLEAMGLDDRLVHPDVVDAVEEFPSLSGLVRLIVQHLLAPADLASLYEMLVAVRIVRALEKQGLQPRPWRVLSPDQPFATLVDASGGEWQVYWQRSHWSIKGLHRSAKSRYKRTMDAAGVKSAVLRPDVVVVDPDGRPCLFEAKHTTKAGVSRERVGVVEMMAYIYDVDPPPAKWTGLQGVVVAHGSRGIAQSESISVCDESDSSIRAVVDRILSQRNQVPLTEAEA